MPGRDKHSSLLRTFLNYGSQKYYNMATWPTSKELVSTLRPLLALLFPGMESTSKKAVLKTGGPSRSKAEESKAAGGGSLLVGSSPVGLTGASVEATSDVVVVVVVVTVVVAAVVVAVVDSGCFGVGANFCCQCYKTFFIRN